jgi:hypothetical protein
MKKENLEVILEDINSKFNLVLEGHEAIRSEIRDLSRNTNERFDLVDFKIDTLNKKIDNVELKLNEKIDNVELKLNEKIDNVESKLSKKIDDVESKLSKKIDDVESKLSKKIDDVESKLSKKIDAVSVDLSAHRADTEAHHGVYRVKESE